MGDWDGGREASEDAGRPNDLCEMQRGGRGAILGLESASILPSDGREDEENADGGDVGECAAR